MMCLALELNRKKLVCIPLGVVQRYPLLSPTLEEKEDLELIDWFCFFFFPSVVKKSKV